MDLQEIIKRGQQIVDELNSGMVDPSVIEMEALNVLSDEILAKLGEIERPDCVKRALLNMFFFGQMDGKGDLKRKYPLK